MQLGNIDPNSDIIPVLLSAQGTRKTSAYRRKIEDQAKTFAGLEDHQLDDRWEVIEILRRVKNEIGLSEELISHIDYIMKRIPVSEWKPGGCPIFYQSVINQAQELGVKDRTIRYREEKLADMGFLVFHDSSNGRRYPVRENGALIGAYGVSLVPLMMRIDELRQKDFEHRQVIFYWRQCKAQIASLRRRISKLINDVWMKYDGLEEKAVEWAEVWQTVRSVRSADSIKVLEARLETFRALEDDIKAVLSAHEDMGTTCERTQDISGTPEVHFRHIDTNTESNNSKGYYSNPHVDNSERRSPKGSQDPGLDVGYAHAGEGVSKGETGPNSQGSKGKDQFSPSDMAELEKLSGAEHLVPAQIYQAACADFRDAVDRLSGNAKPQDLTVQDIRLAGDLIQQYLNVSPYTWRNAKQVIGHYGASIALMLACRPHIRCAGSYLNELITRQHQGRLHLHKSVFGQLCEGKQGRLNS